MNLIFQQLFAAWCPYDFLSPASAKGEDEGEGSSNVQGGWFTPPPLAPPPQVGRGKSRIGELAPLPPRGGRAGDGVIKNTLENKPSQKIWQRNYYDHIIRNPKELDEIRLYIEANPLNWHQDEENPLKHKHP